MLSRKFANPILSSVFNYKTTLLKHKRLFSDATTKKNLKPLKYQTHQNYDLRHSFQNPGLDNELRLGVALGSGSAKGWSHIGIMRALDEAGIKPTIMTGTSVGSLIAGSYAAGMLNEIEDYAKSVTWKEKVNLADLSILKGDLSSFIYGERIVERIRTGAKKDFQVEELPVAKFGCVATKVQTGEEVWITKGSFVRAIRASIAIPGVFAPVLFEVDGKNEWLVDGALVNPVPVNICRALGANFVIAVNLNKEVFSKKLNDAPDKTLEKMLVARLFSSFPKTIQNTISSVTEYLNLSKSSSTSNKTVKNNSNKIMNDFNSLKDEPTIEKLVEIEKMKDYLTSEKEKASVHPPHMIKVITSSILIMQHVITTFRLAADPPNIEIAPELEMEAIEFERGKYAIDKGRECVEAIIPSIKKAISEFEEDLKK